MKTEELNDSDIKKKPGIFKKTASTLNWMFLPNFKGLKRLATNDYEGMKPGELLGAAIESFKERRIARSVHPSFLKIKDSMLLTWIAISLIMCTFSFVFFLQAISDDIDLFTQLNYLIGSLACASIGSYWLYTTLIDRRNYKKNKG